MGFENKVVIVTGSGSGIGRATAILFAKKGADVIIIDWNVKSVNETGEMCKQYGKRVLVIKADVSNAVDVKIAIEKVISEFGKLDVLVNNAGIVREGKILTGDIMETYDEVLNTNLRSIVQMTTLAVPYLIKTKGCVVNTSSIASTLPQRGSEYPAYTISKAGVDSFTRLAAIELAPSGVRVNAVNPGPVLTNLLSNANLKGDIEQNANLTALGRTSAPEEIGNFIVYLASDKAKGITGCTNIIDNGMSLI